jgi:hypothetical protein
MPGRLGFPPPTGARLQGPPPSQTVVAYDEFGTPYLAESSRVSPGVGPAAFAGGSPTDVAVLDVPDAAEPVTLVGLDGGHPEVHVGDRKARVRSFSNGDVIIPRGGGDTVSLQVRSGVPGYPIVMYQGREIFRLARPALADRVAIVVMRVAPFFIGVIPGWFIGEYAARWVVGMVKRDEPIWKRRAVPLAISAVLVVLGVVGIVAYVGYRTSGPGGQYP